MSLPLDTSLEAHRIQIEGYRSMSPAARLQQAFALTQSMQLLALSRLRQQYPTESEHSIRLRHALLTIDRELLQQAFGTLPPGA